MSAVRTTWPILVELMALLRWLTFLLGLLTLNLTVLLFWIYFFLLMLVFVLQWLSLGKFWSYFLSFHWLSNKLKMGCLISLHSLWLFSCWLGWFRLYQQNKSSETKVKFRQASNHCKRVFEAAKLVYATKAKESITSQKLSSRNFWQIAYSVLNKGKFAIPPLFSGLEVLSSASDKAKLFAKTFLRT